MSPAYLGFSDGTGHLLRRARDRLGRARGNRNGKFALVAALGQVDDDQCDYGPTRRRQTGQLRVALLVRPTRPTTEGDTAMSASGDHGDDYNIAAMSIPYHA